MAEAKQGGEQKISLEANSVGENLSGHNKKPNTPSQPSYPLHCIPHPQFVVDSNLEWKYSACLQATPVITRLVS